MAVAPGLFEHLDSYCACDNCLSSQWISGYFSEPSVRQTFTWIFSEGYKFQSSFFSEAGLMSRFDFFDRWRSAYSLDSHTVKLLESFALSSLRYLEPLFSSFLSLYLDPHSVSYFTSSPPSILCRLIRYPAFDSSRYGDFGYRANEHCDPAFLTLLAGQSQPGFQYFYNDVWNSYSHFSSSSLLMCGQWSSFVTNQLVSPLLHRVVFNSHQEERFSLQIFYLGNVLSFSSARQQSVEGLPIGVSRIISSFRDKYLLYRPLQRWSSWSPFGTVL